MQFMISRGNAKGGNWEKFDVQDIAIEKFRKFATQQNVHLTLVVHPRKEDEAVSLGHGDWLRFGDVEFLVSLIAHVGEA